MSKPVYVISCPYDTYSGYGARARDYVKAVIATGKYDVKLLSQRWGETPWGFCKDHSEWSFLLEYDSGVPMSDDGNKRIQDLINKNGSKPDIWSQITIPNEFIALGKYNIGVTAGIETTVCAGDWIEGVNRMDLTLVSSKHSKKVFETTVFDKQDKEGKSIGQVKLEKPVEVLFEGVNLDLYKRVPAKDNTLDLSSIKENFCYLFVGHWMGGSIGHDRKNVGFMIKSFFETFKNQKNKPALLLKVSVGSPGTMSREEILKRIKNIRNTVNSKNLPNVYLIGADSSFSDTQINMLYNHPKVKAMVSFSKGEGYGRPLAEWCTTGKPIIASGWSGQIDFLNPEFAFLVGGELEKVHPSAANKWLLKDSNWFKPDAGVVGAIYKDVFKNYKQYVVRGKKQGHYLRSNFSFDNMVQLLDSILDRNVPDFPKSVDLKLPTLEPIKE